jgi:diguanylate cyclase (GGDEF)-like protein
MLASSDRDPVGRPVDEIIQYPDGEPAQPFSQLVLRPINPIRQGKTHIRRRDGTSVSAEWSSLPIIRHTNIAGTVLTLRDVTQNEASDRFMHFRTELLEMIAHNKPVEDVVTMLATAVETRLPGFHCSVLLCDGECFRVVRAPELPEGFRAAMEGLPCSRLVPASNPNRKSDLRSWEGMLQEIGINFGFGATWIEPLVSSANEVLGTIVLNGPGTEALADERNATLTEAARLAALAVENQRWLQRLLHRGHHDTLTGLPNRLLFADRLKQELARAHRTGTHIALLCIDLDRFKYINDTLGHHIGDRFLQQVSVRLAARIRASDTLARTGGDEFTAVISDIRDQHDAEKLAEALIACLGDPFEVEQHTLYAAASIGIALYPQDGTDAESLHRNADRAMYRAKAGGRNAVRCYSGDDAHQSSETMQIELHLHRAVERGHFSVEFQPQFTCDRRLSGFEALLRFRHPKLGMVAPSRFIPIAEESGLILPIGEWVLERVCRQIAEWQTKGMQPLRVAVNVSPLQFSRADFSETILRVLQRSKVPPDLLELELTEGVLMSTAHDTARQLELINRIGVKLAVDDFGTGYSSLSYLHQLPIHMLKIDRQFINKMLEPGGTRAIVEAIISLAHGLGLRTVAEGVEQEEQLEFLRAAGCDLIQGYIFSHPLSAVEASRLLLQESTVGYGTEMGSNSDTSSYSQTN